MQSPIQAKKQENKKNSSGRGWRWQGRGEGLTKFENGWVGNIRGDLHKIMEARNLLPTTLLQAIKNSIWVCLYQMLNKDCNILLANLG